MIIKIIFQLKCTSKKTKGMIKKMKNLKTKAFKSTKGITLIALVVTIIVLLILAGIVKTQKNAEFSRLFRLANQHLLLICYLQNKIY